MADTDTDKFFDARELAFPEWCCLSCFAKFSFMELRIYGGIGDRIEGNEHGLNCPNCRGMKIHPIDGKPVAHGPAEPLPAPPAGEAA